MSTVLQDNTQKSCSKNDTVTGNGEFAEDKITS